MSGASRTTRSFHPVDVLNGDGSEISPDEKLERVKEIHRRLVTKLVPAVEKGDYTRAFAILASHIAMHEMDAVFVAAAAARLTKRIEALEQRLEQRSYQGIWAEGRKYLKENSVTWGGSVWIALADTTSKPAAPGNTDWRLAVKRGGGGSRLEWAAQDEPGSVRLSRPRAP